MTRDIVECPECLNVVGITGGIASGKSRVAALIAQLCEVSLIDADRVARGLFATGEVLSSLRELIGGRFFDAQGQLRRPLLRREIFRDAGLRRSLDEFSHPLIWRKIVELLADAKREGQGEVLVEVPLLFEAGWQGHFSRVVVVYADEFTCRGRLCKRDGVNLQDAVAAIGAQMPLEDKLLKADHVIDNGGSWWDTVLQVRRLCPYLLKKS